MGKRKALYVQGSNETFKLSRLNIQNYLDCPRCFYIENIHGIKKPSGYPLTINMAVDSILKKEFDHYRENNNCHPEVSKILKLNMKPLNNENFSNWRKNASVLHSETNLTITGKFDDVWINEDEKLYLADYKSGAVSANKEFVLHESFRNQMDIYLWIAKQLDNNFTGTTYFYYKKLKKNNFMKNSKFITEIIEYSANDMWVEEIIIQIKSVLENKNPPDSNPECKHCLYSSQRMKVVNGA